MDVLVGWDCVREAETIGLLLNADRLTTRVTTDPEEFARAVAERSWDVILMALSFPNPEQACALYEKIREQMPQTPVLGACQQGQIVHLAWFMSRGLHGVVTRDPKGEFIMLLPAVIEAALAAVEARRSSQLVDRLREEIESVRQLQESVIPHDVPVPPGYKIVARYEPAQIRVLGGKPVLLAGGDYYDLFSLDERSVTLMLGDAAGHGIKACMSIMTMRTLIRMICDHSFHDTAQFVAEVNRRLVNCDVVSAEGGFITLLYCVLDTATHTLQWTSAGHPMPLLQDLTTGEITTLGGYNDAGTPLAVDPGETYQTVTSRIPNHARLVLYSDGLADAFPNGNGHQPTFGDEGIRRALRATAHLPVHEALDRLFADSDLFTQGGGRHDDTSVVLVERNGD